MICLLFSMLLQWQLRIILLPDLMWCAKDPLLRLYPFIYDTISFMSVKDVKGNGRLSRKRGRGGMCWGLLAKDQLRFKILKLFAKWVNLKKYNNWTWCDLFLPILYSFGLWTLECNWFQAYSASHLDLLRLYHARLREWVENMKPKF